jgi:hypothetical protein
MGIVDYIELLFLQLIIFDTAEAETLNWRPASATGIQQPSILFLLIPR